jgi:serine/threonine protein phosphatase PrpC
LLEILSFRLANAQPTALLSTIIHEVRQAFIAFCTNPDLFGMASTLVGVRVIGDLITIFNVGNSRAYLLTSGDSSPQVRRLSRDHSMVNDMIDDGEITTE